jgi:hypothetical protein
VKKKNLGQRQNFFFGQVNFVGSLKKTLLEFKKKKNFETFDPLCPHGKKSTDKKTSGQSFGQSARLERS